MAKTQVVQIANTVNGWAVGIVRQQGNTNYQVVRINPDNLYITIDWTETESAARKVANRVWTLDMGRPDPEPMIVCDN